MAVPAKLPFLNNAEFRNKSGSIFKKALVQSFQNHNEVAFLKKVIYELFRIEFLHLTRNFSKYNLSNIYAYTGLYI